jgi:uncharacterized protein (TIGR02453 family)
MITDNVTEFTGFPEELLDFYDGLEMDNSRSYWEANKPVYERAVRRPMEQLAEVLGTEFGSIKMFRPYRDLRFSADKRPYQEHASLSAGDFYFSISVDGVITGAGGWHPASDQLERFRRRVDDSKSMRTLRKLLDRLAAAGIELSGDDMLKSAPRGYARDHPEIDVLRCKHLAVMRRRDPGPWLHGPEALEFVQSSWRHMRGWTEWLAENVGPSTEPPPPPRGRRES